MPRRPTQSLWSAAYPRLVAIALHWTYKNAADAEDLAQQALTELAEQSAGDPPTDLRALVARAAAIMKGILLNQRKAAKRRADPRYAAAAAIASRGVRRTPEDLAATRADLERRTSLLLASLEGDDLACDLVRATAEGYETAAEQAEYLKRDIADIRPARRRVARAVDAVNAAEGESLDARDWEAGEGSGVDHSADVGAVDEEGESAEE